MGLELVNKGAFSKASVSLSVVAPEVFTPLGIAPEEGVG